MSAAERRNTPRSTEPGVVPGPQARLSRVSRFGIRNQNWRGTPRRPRWSNRRILSDAPSQGKSRRTGFLRGDKTLNLPLPAVYVGSMREAVRARGNGADGPYG